VAHICNPSYSGGGDGKIKVRGQLGQSYQDSYLKNKLGKMAHAWSSNTSEAEMGGLQFNASLYVSTRPYLNPN
jgi:hypothetical protein